MQSTFSSSTQSSFTTGQSISAHSTDIGDTDTDNTYTMDGNGDENHKDLLYSSLSCASSSNPSAGTTQLPQDASVAWMALAHSRFPVQTPSVSAQIACQRMDTELAAIEKLVLFSRRHRNTLAAISILPVEIMLVIIRLLKRDWRPSDGTPGGVYKTGLPKLPYQLGWMTVSHVCRHWRQLALDHSSLWTDIFCDGLSSSWSMEMIRRSKTAPKTLSINMGCYGKPEVSLSVLKLALEPPSLSTLRVLNILSPDIEAAMSSLNQPMHGLETFALGASQPQRRITLLSPTLLTSLVPSLKHLTLSQCSMIWDVLHQPVFLHLTSLSINFHGLPEVMTFNDTSSPQQLALLLKGMPNLEDLDLVDPVPFMQPDLDRHWENSPLNIPLPTSLKKIYISVTDCIIDCVRFAINMVLPSSTRLVLYIDGGGQASTLLSPLLRKFAGSSLPPRILQFSVFNSDSPESPSLYFRAWDNLHEHTQPSRQDSLIPSVPPRFCLFFDALGLTDPILSNLCEGLYVDDLVDVIINSEPQGLSKAQALSIFKPARQVRRVQFQDLVTGFMFLEILLESQDDPSGALLPGSNVLRTPVLFPVLETLILGDEEGPPVELEEFPLQDVSTLLSIVKFRLRLGTPIQHLFLPSRFEQEEWVPWVKELVADVQFFEQRVEMQYL